MDRSIHLATPTNPQGLVDPRAGQVRGVRAVRSPRSAAHPSWNRFASLVRARPRMALGQWITLVGTSHPRRAT